MQNTQRSLSVSLLILAASAALPGLANAQTGRFVQGPSASFGQAFAQDIPSPNPSYGYATDPMITFPLNVIPARQGTIEFWAQLSGMSPGASSDISLVASTNPREIYAIGIHQNDGLGGGGLFGVVGTATDSYGSGLIEQATAPFYQAPFSYSAVLGNAEAWHHYALVWNDAGLPSGYKTAIYLDGALASVGYRLDKAPSTLPDLASLADDQRFGLLPFNRETQGSVSFDNLIVRDYAKLDFSDRFQETPTGPVVLWNRLGGIDQVLNSEVGAGGALVPEPEQYAAVFGAALLSTGIWLRRKKD